MPVNTEALPRRGQRRGAVPAPTAEVTAPQEETVPTETERPARPAAKSVAGSGWGAITTSSGGSNTGFAKDFKPTPEGTVIRFVDPEPFVVYFEHFFRQLPTGVKKSYPCPNPGGCPICDATDDKPAQKICFNVVDLNNPVDEDGEPRVLVWRVGITVANQIKAHADEPRTSPINAPDRFWFVNRTSTQRGGRTLYNTKVDPVKARDLKEDFSLEPLDTDAIAEYDAKAWRKETYVFYQDDEQLADVAAQVMGL